MDYGPTRAMDGSYCVYGSVCQKIDEDVAEFFEVRRVIIASAFLLV